MVSVGRKLLHWVSPEDGRAEEERGIGVADLGPGPALPEEPRWVAWS